MIGEDSKPFNSDLFCTGAGAGDVPEVKRSEQVSMASRVNCVEELMAVLGDAASESVMPYSDSPMLGALGGRAGVVPAWRRGHRRAATDTCFGSCRTPWPTRGGGW